MKRKISTILALGLSLVLTVALAAPVMADISQPSVSVDPDTISVDGGYTIGFDVNEHITEGDTITVTFPDDTAVPLGAITDFTIAATQGWQGVQWLDAEVDSVTAAGDDEELTVTFTLGTTDNIGESATVRIEILTAAGITNPSEPGDYTLTVETSEEDTAIESASYEITSPVLPGGIYVYNAQDVKVAFETDLNVAVDGVTASDFTIVVGSGTYTLTADLNLDQEGLTLISSDGAADTTIDCDEAFDINIQADEVTVDGFTIEDSVNGVAVANGADDAVIQNNTITDAATSAVAIADNASDATVADNVIEDCAEGVALATGVDDATISGNTISGADTNGGIGIAGNSTGLSITGNTITANDVAGIAIMGALASDDIVIEGNTISENDPTGIHIATTSSPTELVIRGNDILDNEEDGVLADNWSATSVITYNTITGNGDSGVNNADTDGSAEIDATFNWWGTTDADEIDDMVEGEVNYEPFLGGAAATALPNTADGVNADSLDAKDTVGVRVSGVEDADGDVANVIRAAGYEDNPGADIVDAIAFFDVYIALSDDFDIDEDTRITVRLYNTAIDENSVVYYDVGGDFWSECSEQEAAEGIIRVILTEDSSPLPDELTGTAFAVTSGEAEEDEWSCPQCGLVFDTMEELEAHWAAIHAPAAEAAPAEITVEAAPAPQVTVEAPPAPQVTVEAPPAPQVTVEAAPAAAAAPAIPTYLLWIIIGIGAVLVVALIVLIVRTRRVA
jgi:nitrous oxidase accessory protein NosD